MNSDHSLSISLFSSDDIQTQLSSLGTLLHACVQAGASVNFILPYAHTEGVAFWRDKVLPGVMQGGLVCMVARKGERIAGAVQLDYDTPPNQRHRAEVRKLLVHPDFRRQGIARTLMLEIEQYASRLGRSLLTLDTRTGDFAEPLYTSLGYITAGVIPGYCRDTVEDRLDGTTIMYKTI